MDFQLLNYYNCENHICIFWNEVGHVALRLEQRAHLVRASREGVFICNLQEFCHEVQ